MTTDIRTTVLQALTEVLDNDTAKVALPRLAAGHDVDIADLGLDSLSRFDVMMRIEDALEVELDDDQMLEQGSVGALIAYLEAGHEKV